jgi:hypothetical protein
MDESQVREHAEAHGKNVVAGDLRSAGADLTTTGMKDAGTVMPQLPRPVTSSEILSVEAADDRYVVKIRYGGEPADVTVESQWAEHDGKPMIVGMSVA